MPHVLSDVIKNAVFASVDLFLDYVQQIDVDSQVGNIAEFIIDCHNVTEDEPAFALLQEKFEEEFRELAYFENMSKDEITTNIKDAIHRLFTNTEDDVIPFIIQQAITKYDM